MAFQLIDLENWERREFYEHFIKEVVCTYSVVVNIDITNLKRQKLYPAMIWLLTKTVNDMPEFRNRGSNRNTFLSKHIPESGRI